MNAEEMSNEKRARNQKVLRLLQRWCEEEGDYDARTMQALSRILNPPREYTVKCVCYSVVENPERNGLVFELLSVGAPLSREGPMELTRDALRLLMDEAMGGEIELTITQDGSVLHKP